MIQIPLIRRRQIWLPTPAGWVFLLLLFIATGFLLANNIYSFLAPNQPVGARILVVEGWLAPGELDQAIEAYTKGSYERVVTTGGPVSGWPGLSQDGDYATLAASYLAQRGIRRELITAVPAPRSAQERTFLSAVMLREAAKKQEIALEAINVFSAGAHARRSRLLFQMALGQDVSVGVLAARPESYDPDAWWRSSTGVEQIFFQSFGYAWVKCCFWPGPPGSGNEMWAQ